MSYHRPIPAGDPAEPAGGAILVQCGARGAERREGLRHGCEMPSSGLLDSVMILLYHILSYYIILNRVVCNFVVYIVYSLGLGL